MAAHRYWRLTGFSVNGNGLLALSEVRLYAVGVAADASATITCPFDTVSGTLSDLRDGLTTNAASWSAAAHRSSGFALTWDLGGGGADVDAIQLAGSDDVTFPRDFSVQYSDDRVNWLTLRIIINAKYSSGLLMLSIVNPPIALFSTGEKGVWYDPSDMTTLFQDAAGLTPVTAVGQPVGKILDKSGNANHASQSKAGSKPILRQDASGNRYLEFNGSSSYLVTASVQLSTSDKLTMFAGLTQLSSSVAVVIEYSQNINTNPGTFYLTSSEYQPGDFTFRNKGNGVNAVGGSSNSALISTTTIVTALFDIAGTTVATEVTARINKSEITLSNVPNTADSGTGGYGTYPLYIGCRGGLALFFSGQLHGLLIRDGVSSAPRIDAAETWLSDKTGTAPVLPSINLNPASRLQANLVVQEIMLPSAELPATSAQGHLREIPFFDAYNGGVGMIYGTTKEKNTPANTPLRRRVLLIDEASRMTIREGWSDAATGNYEFRGVKQGTKYTVISYDYQHNYRAVIADNQDAT